MSDLTVDIRALYSDGKVWHQASEDLAQPTAAIEPLTLNGADDVTGLGARLGIDTSYERARQKMLALMGEAAGYFDSLASTLVDVAIEYQTEEEKYAERLDDLRRELEADL